MTVHFILYVSDQSRSARFYREVLGTAPSLDVPGMTEFLLGDGAVLGLMPEAGIKRLLGAVLPDPARAQGVPRAELYLVSERAEEFLRRAIAVGGKELSPVVMRDWGHMVGYCLDPDGHVIAFAQSGDVAR